MNRGIKLQFQKTSNYIVSFNEDVLPLETVKKIKLLNIQYEEGFIDGNDFALGVRTALAETTIDIPLFLDSSHEIDSDTSGIKLIKVLEVNL